MGFDRDQYWRLRNGVVVKDRNGNIIGQSDQRFRGQGPEVSRLPIPEGSYIPQGPEFQKGVSKKARRRARKELVYGS